MPGCQGKHNEKERFSQMEIKFQQGMNKPGINVSHTLRQANKTECNVLFSLRYIEKIELRE